MAEKEKSNQRNVKKQIMEQAYKLLKHGQLSLKLQEWMQIKNAYITKALSFSLSMKDMTLSHTGKVIVFSYFHCFQLFDH